ncbi:MAG TPA: type II toxin-antitoxin system death-on-curing family toxin [Xanthobacteraceae bacterium]|jgi:death on curing protein
MNEPRWLTLHDIEDIHAEQLALFGGPAGIRDRGALESALGRPINRWHYENADMAQLAAAYAFGIARNHPFVDGNKRTAFAALMVFLRLNGISFAPPPPDATAAMMALAAGDIDEAGLARWIAANMPSS